jgi:hypothetical protein
MPSATSEWNGLNATKISFIDKGEVKWKVQYLFKQVWSIKRMTYYVLDASVRLFLSETYFMKHKTEFFKMDYKVT